MSDGHGCSVRGIFAGLATLDVVHRVTTRPSRNEKVTASAQFVAAGGPAANAAVTFAALGGEATLVTALGASPIAHTIAADLSRSGVRVIDIAPDLVADAPVSAVAVIEETGERSVIGGDATGTQVTAPAAAEVARLLAGSDVVLIDGHHPELAVAIATESHEQGLRSVIDAGRWKLVMEVVLPLATDVVASADFRTPGAHTSRQTFDALADGAARTVVVTAGADPVQWSSAGRRGSVPVPETQAVDTLGAGDVFHGAYAFGLARGLSVAERIRFASAVAAVRCAHVGPRSWLDAIARIPLVAA